MSVVLFCEMSSSPRCIIFKFFNPDFVDCRVRRGRCPICLNKGFFGPHRRSFLDRQRFAGRDLMVNP